MNSIFLTNKTSLYSNVTGGVQICSQEFLAVTEKIKNIEQKIYYVNFTKNIIDRLLIKIGFENYNFYDVKKDEKQLINFIYKNNIQIVFINMASLVRYAKPIKENFKNNIKIILLSHGNHSGDFLHLISKPIFKTSWLKNIVNKIRLGQLISTESYFRVKYLDTVVALSETELQIENWFGAKQTVFFPRLIKQNFLNFTPVLGRIGFVGRLDHPPNLQGLEILMNAIDEKKVSNKFILRLVGSPKQYGIGLQEKFPNLIEYLGELSDKDLEEEVKSWSLLINPVWWFSTGASTKIAKAISWGVPIITTDAGIRGYRWDVAKYDLVRANSPKEMIYKISENCGDLNAINKNIEVTKKIAQNSLSINDLAEILSQKIYSLESNEY